MSLNLFPQELSPLAGQVGWDKWRIVHKPALYHEPNPFYSYKYISVTEVLSDITLAGDWCQFGVFRGATARVFEAVIPPDRTLHLFDSFEGLPESWGQGGWKQGHFQVPADEVPRFDPRKVQVHRGWFKDTVPTFRSAQGKPLAFLHIDSDLYSSAIDVLDGLNELIVPGTVLLFDEFFMQANGRVSEDECRALLDWSKRYGRRWEPLWRTNWVQACVRVIT